MRGVDSVRSTIEECCRLGVGQLTLYCLSSENWKRPQDELDFLMALLERYLIAERPEIMEQNIRFTVIGRRSGLPAAVLKEMDESIHLSRDNRGMCLCLAINYGGAHRDRRCNPGSGASGEGGPTRSGSDRRNSVSNALYTAGMPDPDLLIRTAGECRVSNYLLWQISYAELWVTEKCWPDFDQACLHQALRDYAGRERRFGGLK